MEQIEREANDAALAVPASPNQSAATMSSPPTQGAAPQGCASCGAPQAIPPPGQALNRGVPLPPPWIYAIGNIQPRFPRISVEKEFAQAMGGAKTAGLTDGQALHEVLSAPHNRYLARQLCWVLSISGVETYLVVPRQPTDLDMLVAAVQPAVDAEKLDVVIGTKGQVAPPEMCNGLSLPVVIFDQLYSFDRKSLLSSIPVPNDVKPEEFSASAAEVLDRILSATDNAGSADERRALNYLALRYPGLYARVADCFARDFALTSIQGHPWPLSAARRIVEIRLAFTDRKNEFVEKYFVRVDVNDGFPFLVSSLAPYFDH
jgi:PatG Domain